MLSRLYLLLALSLSVAVAAEPLFNPVPLDGRPVAAGDALTRQTAAERALALGFPSVAASLYEQLMAESPDSAAFNGWVLALTTARMEAGRLEQAAQDIERFKGPYTAAAHLRAGLLAAQRGRLVIAQNEAAGLKSEDLGASDRPWLYFLQGLLAESAKDSARASQAYDQAESAAVDDWQRASFMLARERVRLVSGDITEAQAAALRQSAERYQGRGVGYDFGRQYAVALQRLGRHQEAVDYLQGQLQAMPSAERKVRDEYRLLLGVVAGADDPAGRGALEALLGDSDDRGRLRAALRLLAEASRTGVARSGFLSLIGRLIDRADPVHAILENLLLTRSEFALASRQFDAADQDAKTLLTRFPGSDLKPLALTQLAQSAWDQNRYLTAADYGSRARAEAKDQQLKARLGVFVAEAYYRARDFRSASGAYAAATELVPAGVSPGAVLFQRVMSELEAGRLDGAVSLLGELASDARFDPLSRWQSEWNLARALQGAGRTGEALKRLTALRAASGADKLPADLVARMAWLQARLALDAGEPRRALDLVGQLPPLLTGVEPGLRGEIESLAHLLSAEAKFKLNRADDAVAELKDLRGEGPGAGTADAKMRSFLVEADYYAGMGRLVEAQALLTSMADKYPQSSYAPAALYKAALNAERRGQDEYLREAFLLLDRLVKQYPDSDKVFYALLKQGDIRRRLNDFAGAQLTYESLVNTSGNTEGVLAAQLALAACHRAQMEADPSHFESAVTILERLLDLPNAPVGLRIEAGFQLGDMYCQRAESRTDATARKAEADRARAVWWPLVSTYLLADDAPALSGARERYWMTRLLVRMSDLAELEGRREESLEACRLILAKGLPGAALARGRLAGRATTTP